MVRAQAGQERYFTKDTARLALLLLILSEVEVVHAQHTLTLFIAFGIHSVVNLSAVLLDLSQAPIKFASLCSAVAFQYTLLSTTIEERVYQFADEPR